MDRIDIEGDRDDDARRCDERQQPGTPERVTEPGSDQQVTDKEQQEAEAKQDEVPRNVPRNGHGDDHLHSEEAEQRDSGEGYAPADPPSPRTDEPAEAPDRDNESHDSEAP